MILVDTNILLRLAQPNHKHSAAALDSLDLLATRDGEPFRICPQNLFEMYSVCTRPISVQGLGMSAVDVMAELHRAQALFPMVAETPGVYAAWEALVTKYRVIGKRAQDVRLVAIMLQHAIPTILTFNDADFRQFTEINVLNPFDVLGIPRV